MNLKHKKQINDCIKEAKSYRHTGIRSISLLYDFNTNDYYLSPILNYTLEDEYDVNKYSKNIVAVYLLSPKKLEIMTNEDVYREIGLIK